MAREIGRQSGYRAQKLSHAIDGPLLQRAIRQVHERSECRTDHVRARTTSSPRPLVNLRKEVGRKTDRYLSVHGLQVYPAMGCRTTGTPAAAQSLISTLVPGGTLRWVVFSSPQHTSVS